MNHETLIEYANLMTVRRDHWREKAETAQAQVEDLQNQLAYWREVAQNRKQRNDELAQLVKVREVESFDRGYDTALKRMTLVPSRCN